jgi:lipopolysaccharide biosynthesis glycosyltransferase
MANVLTHAVKEVHILGHQDAAGDVFHIAMTGTADYISHMGVVMKSVVQYNPDLPITFHFFVNELTEKEKENLEMEAAESRSRIYVHIVDDDAFETLLLSDRIAAFFYRFLIPPAVEGMIDRVLYLDGDMMCRGSLKELADMDLDGYAAAVVSDRLENLQIQRVHTKRYFNAGMMLINVKQWKEDQLFDAVVLKAQQNVEKAGKRLSHHDQDIQNILLDGKVIFLPKKYNYLYNLDRQSLFKKQPVNEPYENQSIIHFAGHAKPWHSWVQQWPVVQEYAALQGRTPWKNVPVVLPKGKKNFHQAARTARMEGRYGDMIRWYGKYFAEKV